MSASWRLTWAISEIGRNEARANRISKGRVVAHQLMLGHQPRPDHGDREAAEPGHDLEQRGLRGEVGEQRQPGLLIAAHGSIKPSRRRSTAWNAIRSERPWIVSVT